MNAGLPAKENKRFCILPWIHLTVLPEGSTKICCVTNSCIESDGVPLSLQSQPLEAIWNGSYLRAVRRNMLAGKPVTDCATCYHTEKNGGVSRRQISNTRWAAELGPLYDRLLEESEQQEHVLSEMPIYYQLMPGNLCNLKCRMCFPIFSSQIERDPVHSRWAPTVSLLDITPDARDLVDWTKGRVILTPQVARGVKLDGFHGLEQPKGQPFRWTNGDATLVVHLPRGIHAESLRMRLRRGHPRRHHLRVFINDAVVYDQVVARRGEERTFRISLPANCLDLTIQLQSSTFEAPGDPRKLGVALELLELIHTGVFEAEVQDGPAARLPAGPWYRDDAWVRDVLLGNASRLRGLYFTGGEPMIEKQVEHIFQTLIEKGVAGNIALEANTNCTILREAMLQKLLQFQEVRLGLSIDAYGSFYEYIRYPSKWAVIQRNVDHLVALSGERWKLFGGIVLQVYNLLNLVEILQFFDARNIPYTIEIASLPWFLRIGLLPARVRTLAADRLRAYAAGPCGPEQRAHVLTIAQQIEMAEDQCTPEALRTLMLFTNDLDSTRRQSIREVHGELLRLLQEEGFHWTDERSGAVAA
jgi:glutamate-1-semialdehyde 2,1-aminomutase